MNKLSLPICNPQSPLISSKSEHGDKSPLHVVLPPSLFSKENRGDEGENKGGQSAIRNGFTLMELLVVIAIIGMLAGILMPSLNAGRERARRAVCMGHLKVIGEAFNMYNIDHGWMPPTEDAFSGNNYATNLIKTTNTSPPVHVGIGYFYYNNYIEDFGACVCPSSSYLKEPQVIKNNWTNDLNTFSAYIYRAESGQNTGLMLSDSRPAIVMDYNDINPATPLYNHKGEYVNILFKNGYVKGVQNKNYAGTPNINGQLTLGGVAADEDNLFRHLCGTTLCGGADNYQ